MRILITGTTGYVGSALIDDLRGKHEIIAAARDTSRITQDGIKKVTLDISDAAQAKRVLEEVKPDVVIHAAALPKRSTVDEETFIRTNVDGAKNLADAVRNHSQAKFIMLSSGCAFKQVPGQDVTASSEREFGTAFSKSKNISEQEVEHIFAGAEDRLALVYPPVILHGSQEKGVIPYSLHDAKTTGVITNKVPGGHVNFITHTKFAELLDAIATDTRTHADAQRYFITGTRSTTEAFFEKLQQLFRQDHGIECTINADADPHIETMCAMDESAIQALKPDFEWGEIDDVSREIVASNHQERSLAQRVTASKTSRHKRR